MHFFLLSIRREIGFEIFSRSRHCCCKPTSSMLVRRSFFDMTFFYIIKCVNFKEFFFTYYKYNNSISFFFYKRKKKTRENDVKCPLRNGTFFDMPITFNIYIQIELEIMLLYIQIFLKN